jgi:DNA-directed RNA polymerase specialized sigma24 family protein
LADVNGDGHRAAERAARQSYGKLVAVLAARSRDVAAAEDALADAFAAAPATWPRQGVPASPEAWLLTAARRRLTDAARRRQTAAGAVADLLLLLDEAKAEHGEHDLPDWRLRLMFACAHPAIDEAARVPLMLQAVLGLGASAIAAAFLADGANHGDAVERVGRDGGGRRQGLRAGTADALHPGRCAGRLLRGGSGPRRRGLVLGRVRGMGSAIRGSVPRLLAIRSRKREHLDHGLPKVRPAAAFGARRATAPLRFDNLIYLGDKRTANDSFGSILSRRVHPDPQIAPAAE